MAKRDAVQNLFYLIRTDRECSFSCLIFKANINIRIAGDQHGDRSRKIPPGRTVDMVGMERGCHLRSLSRLGCNGHSPACLLRILDQEGNTEPHFAGRAGGVERICDAGNGFLVHS